MIPEILAWKSKSLNPEEEKEICPRCGWMAPPLIPGVGNGWIVAGALVLCGYCAYIMMLGEDLKRRSLTTDELQGLKSDNQAWAIIQDLKRFIFEDRRGQARFN